MYDIIRDIQKYIIKQISLELNAADLDILEKLVRFAQVHLVSKVTNLIEDINVQLIRRLCAYLLNVFPLIISRDEKVVRLDNTMLLSLPSSIREKLILQVQELSPQLDFAHPLELLRKEIADLDTKDRPDDFDQDKEILTHSVMSFLKSGLKNQQPFTEHKSTPLIELPLSESPNFKVRSNLGNKEDRLKERESNRDFFRISDKNQLKKSIDQKMMNFMEHNTLIQKVSGDSAQPENKVEEYFSNKKMFGWLNMDKLLLRADVSFKKLFNLFIRQVFDHMLKLQNFDFDIVKEFCPLTVAKRNNSMSEEANKDEARRYASLSKGEVKFTEQTFQELFGFSHTVFKYSMMGLVALFFVMEHFSFLFVQQNTFVKDLISSSMVGPGSVDALRIALTKEINDLKADEEVVSKLEDTVDVGLFRVNLAGFKQSIRTQIVENRKTLKKIMISDMKNLIQSLEVGIEEVIKVCTLIPGLIDEYLELKSELESDDFNSKLVKLKDSSVMFDLEIEAMNMMQETYEYEYYLKKLYLNTLLRDCFTRQKEFSDSFKNARLNFYDEISLHRVELTNEFKAV